MTAYEKLKIDANLMRSRVGDLHDGCDHTVGFSATVATHEGAMMVTPRSHEAYFLMAVGVMLATVERDEQALIGWRAALGRVESRHACGALNLLYDEARWRITEDQRKADEGRGAAHTLAEQLDCSHTYGMVRMTEIGDLARTCQRCGYHQTEARNGSVA